jgi:large subunit ribosomal protein L9
MAKTEVILTHNIVGLGAESDQVKVAAGYARNYLIPQGFAIPLTAANKRRIESLRQRRAEREAHDLNTMAELSSSLSKMIIKIAVKTGADGKMFGSVTAGTIADELKHQCDVSLDKRKIHLEHPLRALGDHEVELRLHANVTTKLKVHIESTTPPETPAPVPTEGKAGGPPAEGRPGRPGRDAKASPGDKAPAAREGRPARPPSDRRERSRDKAAH